VNFEVRGTEKRSLPLVSRVPSVIGRSIEAGIDVPTGNGTVTHELAHPTRLPGEVAFTAAMDLTPDRPDRR
jgi:hypothetical protein